MIKIVWNMVSKANDKPEIAEPKLEVTRSSAVDNSTINVVRNSSSTCDQSTFRPDNVFVRHMKKLNPSIKDDHGRGQIRQQQDWSISNSLERSCANVHECKYIGPVEKSDGLSQVQQSEYVSIFIADIIGFNALKRSTESKKLASMLDRLFAKMDALVNIHGVQRIDVIGSAYMAAANMMADQACDHAARLARFAIDAVAAAGSMRLDEDVDDSPCVEIRAGLHCGIAPGSVASTDQSFINRPSDTVSMASLLENTSSHGHVQCSEAAAAMIAGQARDIVLKERAGGVDVKGRGRMRTFWLDAAPPHQPRTGGRRILSLGGSLGTHILGRSHSSGDAGILGARAGMPTQSSIQGDERRGLSRRPWSVGGAIGFLARRASSGDSLGDGGWWRRRH
jgi:class 3 adenylate cyclase